MVKEAFCSFKVAFLLKEKGFQQKKDNCGYYATEMVYSIKEDDDGNHHFCHQYPACCDKEGGYICAPTLQMAMRWLREEHFIFIQPQHFWKANLYECYPLSIKNGEHLNNFHLGYFNTYEEACEETIKYCLENLI